MRHTYFSFHYADVWRCNQVRNCWVVPGKTDTRFVDSAEYEKVKKKGDLAIKRWINQQMKGASVTAVLIGSETVKRPYVQYEIEQSWSNGMGILGIHINGLKDQSGNIEKYWGEENYLLKFSDVRIYKPRSFQEIQQNIGGWIEAAAKQVGR